MSSSVKIEFNGRAEVQFRSLNEGQRKNIEARLEDLRTDIVPLLIAKNNEGSSLYIMETDTPLIVLLSYMADCKWTVEDIVDKKMLKNFLIN